MYYGNGPIYAPLAHRNGYIFRLIESEADTSQMVLLNYTTVLKYTNEQSWEEISDQFNELISISHLRIA